MCTTDFVALACIAASKINLNHITASDVMPYVSDPIAVVVTSQRVHMKLCGSKFLPLLSTYLLQTRL